MAERINQQEIIDDLENHLKSMTGLYDDERRTSERLRGALRELKEHFENNDALAADVLSSYPYCRIYEALAATTARERG